MCSCWATRRPAPGRPGAALRLPAARPRHRPCPRVRLESQAADMSADRGHPERTAAPRPARGARRGCAALLPHGGSLPEGLAQPPSRDLPAAGRDDRRRRRLRRHRASGAAVRYIPELFAMSRSSAWRLLEHVSRKWRSVSASMGCSPAPPPSSTSRRADRDALQLLRGDRRPDAVRGLGPFLVGGGVRAHPPRHHGHDRSAGGIRHAGGVAQSRGPGPGCTPCSSRWRAPPGSTAWASTSASASACARPSASSSTSA